MRLRRATNVTTLALCLVTLLGCGGGGGGGGDDGDMPPTVNPPTVMPPTGTTPTGTPPPSRNDGVSLGLDVTELSFAAASASAPTPPAQQVQVYFDNFAGKLTGDVFLQVTFSGAAVGSTPSTAMLRFKTDGTVDTANGVSIDARNNITIIGNNVNTATSPIINTGPNSVGTTLRIPPAEPAALGPGKFTGTATVRACLGDSSCARGEFPGSPRTINISYVVDPVASGAVDAPADAVAPRIQVVDTAGSVVIRGQSLGSVTNVRFGATAATAFTVVSNTEVRAQVPAMPAGTYAVVLNDGAVPFNGSVQVVAPITATAQVLAYPGIAPVRATAAVYDDARQALLVVLAAEAAADNKVVRYVRTAAGDWTSTVFAVPNLNDLVLANDGSRLLAVTDSVVMELAPDTLAVMQTVSAPANLGPGVRLRRLALGNDGRAVITTANGRLLSPTLLYSTVNGSFVTLNNAGQLESSALVSTDDGAHIFITRSVLGGAVLDYDSSSTVVGTRPLSLRHAPDQPLAVDQSVTRVIAYNTLPNNAQIRGVNFASLAVLDDGEPGVFTTNAAVVNRAGTRAVALSGSRFFFFDLTASASNGAPLGAPLSIGFSGAAQTAVSADGQVAFFANASGVAVVPIAR